MSLGKIRSIELKKRTSITIDPILLELAKREALNLSALLEIALYRYFYKKGIYVETKSLKRYLKLAKKGLLKEIKAFECE